MLKSMTGYGRGEFVGENTKFTCEIRTVNHRYLDINIKASRQYNFIEDNLRTLLSEKLNRGKVDISITAERFGDSNRIVDFDMALVGSYVAGIRSLAKEVGIASDIAITDLISLPEVTKIVEEKREPEDIWSEIKMAVTQALDELDAMRKREGKKTADDMLARLLVIEDDLNYIESRSAVSAREYADKLKKRVADLLEDVKIDEERLALEVAILADKSDYTEEVVRFKSHLEQFRSIIKENVSVGRKLDFLTQEINREINTVGSKAQDVEVTNLVVKIKSEIEKIREQVQNVE